MTTYTVTASTADGERVFLDMTRNPVGWLLMTREPVGIEHGPRLKDVVFAAVMDPHLSDVQVTEQENP